MLSEISEITYEFIRGIKKKHEQTMKKKRDKEKDRLLNRENTLVVARVGVGGEMGEIGKWD